MTKEPETIQTDHLNIKMARKPGCMIRLEINVDQEATKAAYTKAVKMINKEISIPGFRKGKAPEQVVIQQFGTYIQREWNEILLNTAFKEFLEKTHFYPFSTSQSSVKKAEVKSASLETGAHLTLEYEAKPEIPVIDHATLRLKKIEKETVTKEDVEETLHQIQLRHAKWIDITDRPVQEGDFVDLTIETVEEPKRTICNDLRFEVVLGKMGEWMRRLIIGHHVNESVQGISEREDNPKDKAQDAHFTPTLCNITIKKIKTAELPPLDDELAKKVGVQTLDELKPRIETDLNRRSVAEMQDQLRAQVEEILLKEYSFEIPHSLIEKQRKELLDQRVRELSRSEVPPEQMADRVQTLQSDLTSELDRAYRLFFISRKIADENNIQVYEKEIMNEMVRQLTLPQGQGIIDASMNSEEARSKLFVNVLSQKVLDFLASKATVQD